MNEYNEIRRLQHQAKFNVRGHILDAEDFLLGKIDFDELSNVLSNMIDMEEIDVEYLFRLMEDFAHRQAILSAKIKIENNNQAEIDQTNY